jgi:hypothetical protein
LEVFSDFAQNIMCEQLPLLLLLLLPLLVIVAAALFVYVKITHCMHYEDCLLVVVAQVANNRAFLLLRLCTVARTRKCKKNV